MEPASKQSQHIKSIDENQFIDHDDHFVLSQQPSSHQKYSNQKQQVLARPQDDAQDQVRVRFSDLHPVQEKVVKHGALQFDIKLGWVPKAQITGPIPIAFTHPDMDDLLLENIPAQSLVYFGYRPTNSFDIHKKFYNNGQNYPFNQFHLCKSQFLERFFRKYYSDFQFNSIRKQGMVLQNSPLIFDSYFQGGNLDAVYFEENQYRLMTRVDTNTRGHCNYYYFKVRCNTPGKYVFRIVNMSKPKSLYQRGMRPYIRTKDYPIWVQGCSNVRYGLSKLCEEYQLQRRIYSLKFEYEFKLKDEVVQFCYGIPFTYSDLLKNLNNMRSLPNFFLNKLCYTLSGLQIPLITITQSQKQQLQKNNKYVIAICARVHPGETHGSHITNGFMKALLSSKNEAMMLRKNIIFKIIPMVNPDGVVIGNTRTSFSGKDLNRVYSDKTDFVFPQIIGVRDFTRKMKQKYGKKFLFFMDIHGHSTRKNSFFFGPEYPVFDEQYQKCRMLAKIYANITDIFRYYSCKFRLSSFKQKTCRGYFNSNNIIRTYTFETSMHCFFNFQQRGDEQFTQAKLENLGDLLMQAIYKYVNVTIKMQPLQVEQPINKKKIFKRQAEEQKQDEQNSDQMESDKADSEDSNDDFGLNQLQIFYNRINENREYFFQELMQFNNIAYSKPDKKKKKQKQQQQKLIIANQTDLAVKQISLPSENWKKQAKTKSDWVPKHDFSPRKKQFLSYQKLSNVVFGSTGDINSIVNIKSEILYSSRPSFPELGKSKYTFVNPTFEQGRSQKNFSVMSKVPDFKLQSKSRFFNTKQSQFLKSSYKQSDSIIRSNNASPSRLQNNQNQKQMDRQKQLFEHKDLQRLILEPKNLAILGQKQSKKSLKQDSKHNKQTLRSTSLKILPRKKSIKSFREQGEKINKKVVKNMSEKGLATRLPYLSKILTNF